MPIRTKIKSPTTNNYNQYINSLPELFYVRKLLHSWDYTFYTILNSYHYFIGAFSIIKNSSKISFSMTTLYYLFT